MNTMRGSILRRILVTVSTAFALFLAACPLQDARGAAAADFNSQAKHHGKGSRKLERDREDEQGEDRDDENDRQRDRHGKGHRNPGRHHEDEQDQDRDDDHERHRNQDWDRARGTPAFEVRERDIIHDYFRNRYSNLPPGLAKRGGHLPPGLERHLERNGTLPPGLQKRLTPFPDDLNRRLPPLPSIYRRGTIGRDAVIVNTRTGRIIDIVRGVGGSE